MAVGIHMPLDLYIPMGNVGLYFICIRDFFLFFLHFFLHLRGGGGGGGAGG